MRTAKVALIGATLLAACGGARNEKPQTPTQTAQENATQAAAEEEQKMSLTGTLEKTVEAGGWILNAENKTYLLLFDRKYLDEPWFREGARVRVVGKESPDTVTIYMQGTPFRVEKMEPAEP